MTQDVSALFSPLKVKAKTLRNRIVMPPMVVNRDVAGKDGREWYGRHAKGGPALVIVEATGVVKFGDQLTAKDLKPLVDGIHKGGALAAIQFLSI